MKRNRNTFFSNYNAETSSYFPQPNMNPFTQSNVEQTFYSGPNISKTNDIENRISKLERQITRLEARLNKLETINHEETTYNNTNMYML